jgi:hypothetical protein
MEQLIFIALIIFFSLIESVARARKAKKEGGAPTQEDEGRAAPRPTRQRVPMPRQEAARGTEPPQPSPYATYDADPSYDDAVEGGRWQGPVEGGSRGPTGASTAGNSEELIPADVWEEIMGLARGSGGGSAERPQPTKRRPQPVPRREPVSRLPAPARPRPSAPVPSPSSWGTEGSRVAKTAPVHEVHLSHIGYGTDPSERAPSSLSALGDEPHGNRDGARVRAMLRGQGGPGVLRQAVILHEVLGPPVGLRDE